MPLSTLKALVEAGKRATQGEWVTHENAHSNIGYKDGIYVRGLWFFGGADDEFVIAAANSRPALSALLDVLEGIDAEALGEAISEMEERIECIKRPDDYPKEKYKTTWAIYEAAKAMQKIIGGG